MKAIILGCFLLSGVSGLIFEVAWIRILGLVFGTSSFAITTVLTSFMTGLALGSFFTGRLSDRKNYNTLRGYGILEILVGLYGAMTPILCSYLMQQYAFFYERFSPNFYLFSLLRFFVLFLILLPPTALMGSTLPLLCKFLTSRNDPRVGLKIGLLYGINTLGAVVGTLLAGFLFIPFLGVSITIYTASSISILAGITAIFLSFHISPNDLNAHLENLSEENQESNSHGIEVSSGEFRFMLFGFACSGAIALGYETGWSRILVLILGGAVYSFTTMLATFLLGLAIGSLIMAQLLDHSVHRAKEIFCALQWSIGMTAFASMHLFHRLPEWYVNRIYHFHENFIVFHLMKCGLAASIMFLPTLGLGMMFPLMARLKVNQSEVGRAVGDVYSINTIGSILGAFGMGFILMPLLGVSGSLFLCVVGNLLIAGLGWIFLKKGKWIGFVGFLGSLLFCLAFPPIWNPSVMTSGVFRYAPEILKKKAQAREESQYIRRKVSSSFLEYKPPELRYYRDGLTCTVSVHQYGDELVYKTNGKPDASSSGDLPTQLLLGHLPLLFSKEEPVDTLIIGLASGVTAGSALCYPNKVVCVELEEASIEAAKFFHEVNRHVITPKKDAERVSEYPNFELKIIDARNYLLGTEKQYSAIISEPSNPWMSGVSNLFTKEFFQLCRKRLKPAGILCQWIQLYEISSENLRILLGTLHSEFKYVRLFHTRIQDIVVLASNEPILLDWSKAGERLTIPAVKEDLARIQITHPFHLAAHYITSSEDSPELFSETFYNQDDNAYIEFSTPRQIFLKGTYPKLLKDIKKASSYPLKKLMTALLPDQRLSYFRTYVQHLIQKNYEDDWKDLTQQFTELRNFFSGKELGEFSAWIGLCALLTHENPEPFFQLMEQESPEFEPGLVWRQEWKYASTKNLEETVALISTLSHPEASRFRAMLYFQQGQDQNAILSAEKAYPFRKDWALTRRIAFLNTYGRACILQKQYERGIQLLKESETESWQEKGKVQIWKFDNIYRDIAEAYLRLNQMDQFALAAIQAFTLGQDQSLWYYHKALDPQSSEVKKQEFLQKAVELDPSFYQASLDYWKQLKTSDPKRAKELEKQINERFSWFEAPK
ncbi:MAG: fused MFS/spermidine synthase [Planctomycetota bacterium]